MKEKVKRLGFTLIELLAVIVILAIIALIATPVILNIIGKIRRSAFERSVENVIKAGNIKNLEEQLDYSIEDIRFECDNNSCISSMLDEEGNNKRLNISGSTGKGYVLVYKNGDIELALEGSGWCAIKNKDVNKVSYTKGTCDDIKKNDYDNESGISKYKYELSGVKSEVKEINENIYTFENLGVGSYTVKVTVYNGNNLISEEAKEITLKPVCPLPVITVGNKDEWAQSKQVTIDYGSVTGCIGKYSLDGSNFTTGNTVTINENNKTIYAVNEGGSNSAVSQETITKIDVTAPTLDITNVPVTTKSITIEFSASDDDSKIKNITCEYGTDINYGNSGVVTDNNKCTIDNLIPNATYYYKITVNDNALNSTFKTGNIKTNLMEPAPSDTKGLLGIVYLNPNTGKACNDYTLENSNTNVWDNKCMKWYVYRDNGNSLDMILDHNAISNVQYNSNNDNTKPKEIETALNTLNAKWKIVARLISADEVASITENTNFNESTSTSSDWFFLDSNNQTQVSISKGASKYYWLYDYTFDCENHGCSKNDNSKYRLSTFKAGDQDPRLTEYWVRAYWTNSPVKEDSSAVWIVGGSGNLGPFWDEKLFSFEYSAGLRPVITISKQ